MELKRCGFLLFVTIVLIYTAGVRAQGDTTNDTITETSTTVAAPDVDNTTEGSNSNTAEDSAVTTDASQPEAGETTTESAPQTTDGDDCASQPCKNEGTCTDGVGTYTCACTDRWTGPTCEERVPFCKADSCVNGVCSEKENDSSCICREGWKGAKCDEDIDECAESTDDCRENSMCANTEGGFNCPCALNYEDVDGKCEEVTVWPDFTTSPVMLQDKEANQHIIDVPIPFAFHDRVYHKIYVYGNGYVSLGSGRVMSHAPLPTEWPYSPALIGVYWSDMEFPTGSSSMVNITEDDSRLSNVSTESSLTAYVRSVIKNSNFQPLYSVAITWINAIPRPAESQPEDFQKATFQLILTTDGKFSYGIVGYKEIWMNTQVSGTPRVTTAYSMMDGSPMMQSAAPRTGPHKWLLFADESTLTSSSYSCVNAAQQAMTPLNYNPQTLPPCPCHETQAKNDPWFMMNALKCYNSRFYSSGIKQSCCYDTNGVLSKELTADRLPVLESDGSRLTNVYSLCCNAPHNQMCNWFFENLEVSNCSSYVPPVIAAGFGDPHITTFDKDMYTFAGQGEYVLFRAGHLELQGRTMLDNKTNTTGFIAYALRPAENITSYQFYLSGAVLEGDWTAGVELPADQFHINKSAAEISFFLHSYLMVKISHKDTILQHTVLWTKTPEVDHVEGLMGNFDGDKNNDVVSKTGTVDGQAVNDFAESWRVNKTATLFDYLKPSNTSFEEINVDTGFSPRIIPHMTEEVLSAIGDERGVAEALCGNILFCLQDYLINKNNDSATQVRMETEHVTEMEKALNSSPLEFTNKNDAILIDTKKVFELTLEVNDASFEQFEIAGSLSSRKGVTLDKKMFTWNLTDDLSTLRTEKYPQSLMFLATNAESVTAVYVPPIRLCLCESEAQCSTELAPVSEPGGDVNGNVISLACDCGEKKTGQFCEKDANICQNCFDDSTCNKTLENYCTPCPDGFEGDGKICADVDECQDGNGGCQHFCNNTAGNYTCYCRDGYEMDGKMCLEIDECRQNASICGNNLKYCFNQEGSYKCMCYPGLLGEDCVKAPFTYLGNVSLSPASGQTFDFVTLTDPLSEKYKELAMKVVNATTQALGNKNFITRENLYVEVQNFEPDTTSSDAGARTRRAADSPQGTIAKYRLSLAESKTVEEINKALRDANPGNDLANFEYYGITVVKIPQVDENADLCKLPNIHMCDLDSTMCEGEGYRTFCICKEGYTPNLYDPYYCEDFNECENNLDNKYCEASAVCVNMMGGYRCDCQDRHVWDSTSKKCVQDKCNPNPCKHDGVCILTDDGEFHCNCEYEWDGPICDDEETSARKMKIAVISVSVILGFICLCLLIIITVMCVKHRRTLDSHAYTNSRYTESGAVVLPRAKVSNSRNSAEMSENGRSNAYDNLNSHKGEDENYTSFGRHAQTPGDKKSGSNNVYYNRAYEDEVGERL